MNCGKPPLRPIRTSTTAGNNKVMFRPAIGKAPKSAGEQCGVDRAYISRTLEKFFFSG